MDTIIDLKQLTTGYQSKHGNIAISSEISASLHKSEITCILGPNGAGKSTLLRTLCGFQKPLGGSVEIMGRKVETYSKAGELKNSILSL